MKSGKPKIKFITLGCKVNQYETQGMREALKKAGALSVSSRQEETADYVIVNTCTVTAEADRENHYWIRRARRENPNARIVVTGCGVERNRADYASMKEVHAVLMNYEKAGIAEHLELGRNNPRVQPSVGAGLVPALSNNNGRPQGVPLQSKHEYTPLSISETEGQGRAFVKIQDGCNHACSFCKVVMVRGRSRSRSLQDTVAEVVRLRDAGYREIVFAGIQLGAYVDKGTHYFSGLGQKSNVSPYLLQEHVPNVGALPASPAGGREAPLLSDVLHACSQIEGIERLRLSSIEPTDVTPSLIAALRDIPKCCPQLHIPLQSGDDEILQRMNRRYNRAFYQGLIASLRSELPHFCLTLDVMAGFPGESEKHFGNTMDLLRAVKPLKCHVFPYSRREGTRAAKFADLPREAVRVRVKRLIHLGREMSLEVRRPYIGKTVLVLAETFKKESGLLQGLTPQYLKVHFPGFENQIGQIMPVKLLSLEEDGFLGTRML